MIKISDGISLEIPELEKDNTFIFIYLKIWYGYNGILPTFELSVDGQGKEVTLQDVTIKLIVDSILVSNAKSIITNYKVQKTTYTFSGYLIKSHDFVFGTKSFSYGSLSEAISSIWNGTINFNIPNISDTYLTQANENNLTYLTKLLKSCSSDSVFYFGLFNDISELSMIKTSVTKDFVEDANNIPLVTVERSTAELNPHLDLYSEDKIGSTGNFTTTLIRNKVSFSTKSESRLEQNYISSQMKVNRGGTDFMLNYGKPGIIQLGDICRVKMTNSVILKLRAVSTVISIVGTQVTCKTLTNNI